MCKGKSPTLTLNGAVTHCEELPGIANGFPLEVVPKGPVAQHLKEGMMVHILAHVIQVIVLATSTYTLQ